MLKVLRENLKSLHWVLWLVVGIMVLFVFAQWGGGGQFAGTGAMNTAVEVGSESVSIGAFRRAYEQLEQRYRQTMGEGFTPEMARQMRLPLIVLGQLVQRELLLQEARAAGLRVSDEELRQAILEMPRFSDAEGQWIGEEAYRQILRANGYNVESFQEALRRDLLIQKLQDTLRRSTFVSSDEVKEEYRRQQETATIRYLALPASEADVPQPTAEEVEAYYKKHREEFRLPVRRAVDYLIVDRSVMASELEIADEQIRSWYDGHRAQFTTPAQVHARHILLRTGEERTAEEARMRLEDIRLRVQEGADFAEIATQVSEDPGSSGQGGDLGWFGRDEMVSAFSEAAFGAEPGQMVITDTPFGVHLILVLERREGGTRPLAELRSQIVQRLQSEQAAEKAETRAQELVQALSGSASAEAMQRLATETPAVRYATTEPFGREDYVPEIGRSNAFTEAAFEAEVGEVTGPVRLSRGPAVLVVREELPSSVPPLEEIREQVQQVAWQAERLKAARQRLDEARQRLKQGVELETVAADLDLEPVQAGPFSHGQSVGQLGAAAAVAREALELSVGEIGGPVVVGNAAVLFEVTERVRVDPQQFAQVREQLHAQLVERRMRELLSARLAARKENLEIHYNDRLLATFGMGPLAEQQTTATG